MFDLPIMIFISIIMFIVQVSVWTMFPRKLKDVLLSNPIFGFLVNLAGSALIAGFTGIASIVGVCNLIASVLFGAYAYAYQKINGIKGLGLDWYRAWNIIPFFPRILVIYEKDGKNWVL